MQEFSKTFIDSKNRAWVVEITWGTARRVKDRAKLDIDSLIREPDGKQPTDEDTKAMVNPFLDLIRDKYRLLEVLGVILMPDIEKAGITLDDFFAGLAGPTILPARDAFCQALYDFFHCPLKRSLLKGAMTSGKKMEEVMGVVAKRTTKELRALEDVDVVTLTNDALDKALQKPSTSSPASQG